MKLVLCSPFSAKPEVVVFLKPNAIVYVRRGGLIIAGKHIKPARFSFPEDGLKNLEVIDPEVLGEACQQFFEDHDVHGQRILLVLDHSVVFAKTIALDKSGKPGMLTKDFIDAMPFEPGLRSCLSLKTDDSLRLFATNFGIYDIILEALRAAKAGRIVAITPVAAYGISETEQLSGSIVDQLLHDSTTQVKANFQSVKPE